MGEWILVVMINQNTSGSFLKYFSSEMTFSECQNAAKTFNAKVPSGGDAETVIGVVCTKKKLELQKWEKL